MVEKKYFCNLCREQLADKEPFDGTGFEWYGGPQNKRIRLVGMCAANNHICWACVAAVGEHDRELRTTKA
jgi:hypothetical protein